MNNNNRSHRQSSKLRFITVVLTLMLWLLPVAALRTLSPQSAFAQNGMPKEDPGEGRGSAGDSGDEGSGGSGGRPRPALNRDAPDIDLLKGPSQETLDQLNPFNVAQSPYFGELNTPGAIISRVLMFIFPLSGLILFVMLVWGGFEVLMGAANKKSVDAGKQRITAALVGFGLLFASYWIAQIIEWIFGITILGTAPVG